MPDSSPTDDFAEITVLWSDEPPTIQRFSDLDLPEAAPLVPTADTRGAAEVTSHTPSGPVPLTPRRRVNQFFASIGLGNLDIEHVIEAKLLGSRPAPKGREADASRMACILAGSSTGIIELNSPGPGVDDLTPEQVEELDSLRPVLQRMMADAYRRILIRQRRAEDDVAPRTERKGCDTRLHSPTGRTRRVATNGHTRGSRRVASSPGGEPPGDDEPLGGRPHLHLDQRRAGWRS